MPVPYIEQSKVAEMILAGALDADTCIVDVRGDHSCDGDVHARHIMGAINIDRFDKTKARDLATNLQNQQKKRVIFHCYYSNFRGPKAAKTFTEVISKSFPNFKIEVRVLKGGWSAWKNQYKADPRLIILDSHTEESDEDEEQKAMINNQQAI